MRLGRLSLGLLGAALALAACAGVSADFVKEGATREQVRADNAACRSQAEARFGRDDNITRDIRAGRSSNVSEQTRLVRQTRDVGVRERYDRVFATCLRARGYSQRKG